MGFINGLAYLGMTIFGLLCLFSFLDSLLAILILWGGEKISINAKTRAARKAQEEAMARYLAPRPPKLTDEEIKANLEKLYKNTPVC